MKRFLSQERQAHLIQGAVDAGMPMDSAKDFAEVPDDLQAVDLALLCHSQTIAHFRRQGQQDKVLQGLACLIPLMEEAIARGFGENDFPETLAFIKDDIGTIN